MNSRWIGHRTFGSGWLTGIHCDQLKFTVRVLLTGMNKIEKDILAALQELDTEITSMRAQQKKANLLPLFSRLDELATQLPPGTDPDLMHYLRKKSYEKAKLLLEGRNAENRRGTCGN